MQGFACHPGMSGCRAPCIEIANPTRGPAQLTVTEDNLEIMIELAAEWKVLCVLHKCERLLCKQLVHLRYHSTGWKALAMADGMCGCVGADRRPIMDCDECDVENVLRKLAWVATLASKWVALPVLSGAQALTASRSTP